MTLDPIMQIGKASLTDENVAAVAEAMEPRELIKISVLKNCADDPKIIANEIAIASFFIYSLVEVSSIINDKAMIVKIS